MRVSVFDQFGALNSPPVFAAIRQGLERIGATVTSHDHTADVAVIWSMVWSGRMRNNRQVWQQFRQTNRTVIVAEVGMLCRGLTWKLGINGTGIESHCYNQIAPGRADRLGIRCQPWKPAGSNIVIATQRADSEQWANQPPLDAWLRQTVEQLRNHTDRPIMVRPHPRFPVSVPAGCGLRQPQKIAQTYDSFDFDRGLDDAWAVINWNSGPGSQAVIAGVPAFVGPSSMAAPVANLDWSQIEKPVRPDRDSWLNWLAHAEWTVDEIASGEPLSQLRETHG